MLAASRALLVGSRATLSAATSGVRRSVVWAWGSRRSSRRSPRSRVAPVFRRDRRGLQRRSRSVLRRVGPPGGPDASKYEGGWLNGRHRQRKERVFNERERLDAL